MRYLEVRDSDGLVVNCIVWDGVSPYSPPGVTLVSCESAPGVDLGWRRVDGGWQAPPSVPTE